MYVVDSSDGHLRYHIRIGPVKKEEIPKHIEIKRYYDLIMDFQTPNAHYVRENIVCLPSWYPVDYKLITEEILDENRKGRR